MGYCTKCHGIQSLVIGLLVLANWYWQAVDWGLFVGALFIIGGFIMMMKPSCPCNAHCCQPAPAAKPAAKKKRRR